MANCINIFGIDCSTITCPDGLLGAADVMTSDCSANINRSEVNSVILVHPTLGTPIANWGAGMVALDFDIDNSDATDVKQKQFVGRGSFGEPETTTTTLNDFREYDITKTYTLTFTVFDIGDSTYDFMRKIECGSVTPLLYFTTVAGKIYGKDGGICPKQVRASLILDEGSDAIERWQVQFIWEAKTAPDRFDYPL